MSLTAGLVGAAVGGSVLNSYLQWRENEYQHDLQRDIFNREDTSIQRRVADLKAAGLSPVLAAGQGAGTGGTVSTTVPQTDLSDRVLSAMSLMKMEADISKTRAEESLIDLQKSKVPSEISNLSAQAKKTTADAYKSSQEGRVAKVTADNITTTGQSGSSWFGKAYNDVVGGASKAVEVLKKEQVEKSKGVQKSRSGFEPKANLNEKLRELKERPLYEY